MTNETRQPHVEILPAPEAAAPPATSRRDGLNSRFTFEVVLILLSILLGFGISEWRQYQTDQELSERVHSNLRTEISYNLEQLETLLDRHQRVLQLLESADVSDSQISGWDIILSKIEESGGGVGRPSLRKGAWDAAISTGALRLLSYELVAELSEIYNAQEDVNSLFDFLVMAYQTDTFRPGLQSETVQVFRWTMVEMVNMEQSVMALYRNYLQENQEIAED